MPKEDNTTIRLHRDESGKVEAIAGLTPTLGIDVEIMPLTYGQSRKLKSFGEPLYEWTDEDKMTLINHHIAKANGKEIHIADLDDMYENFDAWTIEDLVQAVFFYSGLGRLYDPGLAKNAVSEATEEVIV